MNSLFFLKSQEDEENLPGNPKLSFSSSQLQKEGRSCEKMEQIGPVWARAAATSTTHRKARMFKNPGTCFDICSFTECCTRTQPLELRLGELNHSILTHVSRRDKLCSQSEFTLASRQPDYRKRTCIIGKKSSFSLPYCIACLR